MADAYSKPPVLRKADGNVRRVGIELEFAGLRIEKITNILQDAVGGNIKLVSAYEHKLLDTRFGNFGIELDYNFLLALGRKETKFDLPESLSDLSELSEDLVSTVARMFVPFEVVTPPLPMDDLEWLDTLCGNLRDAGAMGTRSSLLYGFGLHLNPELPDLELATVLRYFRAFLVSYAWLKEQDETDLTRQITPHIQPFAREYVRKVLNPEYRPTMAQLIDDYLTANPTRNRAMDMLPLFATIDEQRVRDRIEDVLVKARPTLHYRLPNCEIDQDDWHISDPWNHWMAVERLAEQPERLQEACDAYLKYLSNPVAGLFGVWAERSSRWLSDPASA